MLFLFRILLWLLVGCSLAVAQTPPDSTVATASAFDVNRRERASEYLQQARQYVEEGRTAEAQHWLSQAISLQHDLTEAYLLRADLKREARDLPGAIVDYSVAVHQRPELYEARFQRATAQYEAGRYGAARTDFQYLLDHPAGETNAIYFKGSATPGEFVASGVTTLQTNMKLDLLNYIGLCYWHDREFKQASSYFEQAVTYQPDDPMGYVNLGLTSEALGDTLAAIRHYQRALERDPSHAVALRNLASLARKTRNATLEEQLLIYGEHSSYDAFLQRGMYYHQHGDYPAAIESFSRALELSPQQPEALVQRGFAYEKARRDLKAEQDYTHAIRLNPQSEKAFSNRGNVRFRQKQYTAALDDYNQALALNADNATVWYNRGLTHHRLGQLPAACQDLTQALTLGYQPAKKPLDKLCRD